MNITAMQRRKVALIAVLVLLALLLGYVALRSGPLAPVSVTTSEVESCSLRPALFGVGTIDAERTYRIGPTFAGRVRRLTVNVGDQVVAGQVVGEMDPVDLDDKLSAQSAAVTGAEVTVREATARQTHAATEARRYERLLDAQATSEEVVAAKRHDLVSAEAAAASARSNWSAYDPNIQDCNLNVVVCVLSHRHLGLSLFALWSRVLPWPLGRRLSKLSIRRAYGSVFVSIR